jgi:hypothetical protein
MAVKAFVTKVVDATPDVNDNLVLSWEVFYVGPEIAEWSQGASRIYRGVCMFTMTGIETLIVLGTMLSDCAVATLVNDTGIVMSGLNVYLPQYQKGSAV